ncbi:DNA polymerase zeta processivity subunit isoform X1 [Arachis stenosperma]|uniref:DNA polymerase zeta processivity subunit isoform X1 n=1 Tax=Arachis stenosperma TaxID=217475 RepID=UPI0025ABF43F|nr:DNA polymerase zeta processivity subunit isoform X1 [Arachis stenosperma]
MKLHKGKQLLFWLNSWRWLLPLLCFLKAFILLVSCFLLWILPLPCPFFFFFFFFLLLLLLLLLLFGVGKGAFERRRYMNVVVQRARHPQLRYYIHATVSGFLPFLQKGMVDRVAVVFFNTDNVPLEKFIFKLTVNQSYGSSVEGVDLQISLRSFLAKLSVSESLTKKLPPDCRWEITGNFQLLPETGTSKEANFWIPTDTKQWEQPPFITPIRSMSSDPLCLQFYIEHPSLSESSVL